MIAMNQMHDILHLTLRDNPNLSLDRPIERTLNQPGLIGPQDGLFGSRDTRMDSRPALFASRALIRGVLAPSHQIVPLG